MVGQEKHVHDVAAHILRVVNEQAGGRARAAQTQGVVKEARSGWRKEERAVCVSRGSAGTVREVGVGPTKSA